MKNKDKIIFFKIKKKDNLHLKTMLYQKKLIKL